MAWKVLIFLSIIAVGVSAGRFELKGKKKTQLRETVETFCDDKDFVNGSQRIQFMGLAMEAIECIYKSVDDVASLPQNATSQERFLNTVSGYCAIRLALRDCAQQVIEYLAPCTSAPVQAQIGDMKNAITELFKQLCDDNMAKTHSFIDDGGVECIDKKVSQLDKCTVDVDRLILGMPDDTKSLESIELCNKYDTMTSCILDNLSDCPKPSTKELAENTLALIRSGSFCRATVPVSSPGNDI